MHAAFKWKDTISGFPVSPGSAEALVRWGGKIKYVLIVYFLSNIFAKNCCNRDVYVKIIASQRWDVFWDTVLQSINQSINSSKCISTAHVPFKIPRLQFEISLILFTLQIKLFFLLLLKMYQLEYSAGAMVHFTQSEGIREDSTMSWVRTVVKKTSNAVGMSSALFMCCVLLHVTANKRQYCCNE